MDRHEVLDEVLDDVAVMVEVLDMVVVGCGGDCR